MAPDLTSKEEDRLMALAIGYQDGCVNDEHFLASILLRTIRALEREDDYQSEQRERNA